MPDEQSEAVVRRDSELQTKTAKALKQNIKRQLEALHTQQTYISSQVPAFTSFVKHYAKPKSFLDKLSSWYVSQTGWKKLFAMSAVTVLTALICVFCHYSAFFSLVSATIYMGGHHLVSDHAQTRRRQSEQLTQDLKAVEKTTQSELETLQSIERQLKETLSHLCQHQLAMIQRLKRYECLEVAFENKITLLEQQNQDLCGEKNKLIVIREQLQQQLESLETDHAEAVHSLQLMRETLAKNEEKLASVNLNLKEQGLELAHVLTAYQERISALEETKRLLGETINQVNQQRASNVLDRKPCETLLAQSEAENQATDAHINGIKAFIAQRKNQAGCFNKPPS